MLCLFGGILWLSGLPSLPEDCGLPGFLSFGAGGLLLILAGLFGFIGKPRALVPLLDFFALFAALAALWKVGPVWRVLTGIVLSSAYLVSCNATTVLGNGEENGEPDYSELHPWWENMETVRKEYEAGLRERRGKSRRGE